MKKNQSPFAFSMPCMISIPSFTTFLIYLDFEYMKPIHVCLLFFFFHRMCGMDLCHWTVKKRWLFFFFICFLSVPNITTQIFLIVIIFPDYWLFQKTLQKHYWERLAKSESIPVYTELFLPYFALNLLLGWFLLFCFVFLITIRYVCRETRSSCD